MKYDPDMEWSRLRGGVLVGVKGELLGSEDHGNSDRFRCHALSVAIEGSEYRVVAVDIPSQPWTDRSGFLDTILRSAGNNSSLVLGDFNTPPGARGFRYWNNTHSLANRGGGQGFTETWPYGIPLLTLDQLWISRDLQCVRVKNDSSLRSDHARLVFSVKKISQKP